MTPTPEEVAALVAALNLGYCSPYTHPAADALLALSARVVELEQTVTLLNQKRLSESVDANVRLGNAERECAELQKDRERLVGLRDLIGYVQDGSSTMVCLFQDDATRDFFVRVGTGARPDRYWADSFMGAIDAALAAKPTES